MILCRDRKLDSTLESGILRYAQDNSFIAGHFRVDPRQQRLTKVLGHIMLQFAEHGLRFVPQTKQKGVIARERSNGRSFPDRRKLWKGVRYLPNPPMPKPLKLSH